MSKKGSLRTVLRAGTAVLGLSLLGSPAGAIVINDAYTPNDVVDTTNVTGIGQMVVDLQNGYIGTCTATLINPRTVIFAAHCVNENADDTAFKNPATYGAKQGGTPIGFFFNANNNVSGNSAIGHWLNGVNGAGVYQTRVGENAYNANYVIYNPLSTSRTIDENFFEGDVAMAALDTPASAIPTWTLLFSPLSEPTHATIEGYGRNGIGTTGAVGSDYRRRVAENTISLLGSLDDVDNYLFGGNDNLPTNLYMTDFNDPKFGTADASEFDFNIFHDAALAKEGITAPGDSGGPLIVDQTFNKQVVAAVLSGGSRFWNEQPSAAYGTTSFYQPLYLYWDWIVTNNPYKYVSAKAGDGSWTDPTHWVMNLDPNYVSIVDGALSNTLPTEPAQGAAPSDGVNTPKFGEVCYFEYCLDVATGEETVYSDAGKAASSSGLPDRISLADSGLSFDNSGTAPTQSQVQQIFKTLVNYELQARSAAEGSALVNGVAIQGAPGSSNFVPSNSDGDNTQGLPPRYYDVTLSADGTTTLSDAAIIIDRLTINGAKTGLTIGTTGALGTMIDTTVYAGSFRVDGLYVSQGDIALLGGVLSGNGTVVAPNTTAVLGAIAPGTQGSIGTLTIQGNVVLASKSGVLADVSAAGSDLLVVDGSVDLGGSLVVTPVGGYTPKWRDTRTVMTAATITGAFDNVPDTLAGVLYPTVRTVTIGTGASAYQSEVVSFEAAKFASILTSPSDDQVAIGGLLDKARGNAADLTPIYDAIDPQDPAALGTSLAHLTPDAARATPKLLQLVSDAYTSFLWQYLADGESASEAKVAIQTDALKLAENSHVGSMEMRSLLANLSGIDNRPGAAASVLPAEGGYSMLPKGMGVFLSGQKLDGIAATGGAGGKADVDGYLVAMGVDLPFSQSVRAGVSFAYGEAEADLRGEPATSKTAVKQIVGYGTYTPGGYFVSGYVGASLQSVSTHRMVDLGTVLLPVNGHTSGASPMFGAAIGTTVENILKATVRPSIGVQYGEQQFDGYTEGGSAAALHFNTYRATDASLRLGFDAKWRLELKDVVLKPSLHAFSVVSLSGQADPVSASLAAAPDASATFKVAEPATGWADLGFGLEADLCDNAVLGFHVNANPGRADASYQAFGGSLKIKF